MKILLIEDNRILTKSLIKGLKQEGFTIEHFIRGDDAESFFLINKDKFDIIILDLMLPGKSGEEICKNIRENQINIPIIMLTAKNTLNDKINGLTIGADDYLIKPFEFKELVARLKVLTRRTSPIEKNELKITSNIIIDFNAKIVIKNNTPQQLSLKEFLILEFLSKNIGIALSRDKIFDKVFDFAADNWSNTVDVHIKNIRKKLFKNEKEDPIKTVRGIGYRLEQIK